MLRPVERFAVNVAALPPRQAAGSTGNGAALVWPVLGAALGALTRPSCYPDLTVASRAATRRGFRWRVLVTPPGVATPPRGAHFREPAR
jgi:hypothetical protein